MKTSIEHLYHFNCDSCQKWWAIADFPWGSQSSLWCPWCGYENTLPEKPSTGDDFINGQTLLSPSPGQIYRHYKHNPAADKWHEYRVIAIIEPGDSGGEICDPLPIMAKHTETGILHSISKECITQKHWSIPVIKDRSVLYQSTKAEKYWLRPLSIFTDGRFTLVS